MSTFSVALLQIGRFVVCRETRAACSHIICAFNAVFDSVFAYNGERAAADIFVHCIYHIVYDGCPMFLL